MSSIDEEILVKAPLHEVWDFFADQNNLTTWCANVFAVQYDGDLPVPLGAQWSETWRWAGRTFTLNATLAELDPPHLMVTNYLSTHGATGVLKITYQPEGGGTCTRLGFSVSYSVPLGVFPTIADRILFDKLTSQQVGTNLEALRHILERRHTTHRYHATTHTEG